MKFIVTSNQAHTLSKIKTKSKPHDDSQEIIQHIKFIVTTNQAHTWSQIKNSLCEATRLVTISTTSILNAFFPLCLFVWYFIEVEVILLFKVHSIFSSLCAFQQLCLKVEEGAKANNS